LTSTSSEGSDNDGDTIDDEMPGLQQRCDDDSSSDNNSIGYQRDFDDQDIFDSGAIITLLSNKVNQRTLIAQATMPPVVQTCVAMTDDILYNKVDQRTLVNQRSPTQAMMPQVAQTCAAMTDDEFKKYKRKMNATTSKKILSKKDFRKGRY